MKVTDARFIISAMKPEQYPKDGKPEIAFVGRSNVGKSTLLNRLLGRKSLAKTSATPGKTQTINFFLVNEALYFVDLPGYGFAKVPLKVKEEWGRVMMAYLAERETLRMVVLLLDARHKPTANDQHMLDLLEEAEVPTLLVATKFDKLKKSEQKKNLATMRDALGLDDDAEIIPVASPTGKGVGPLWGVIGDMVG